VFSSFGDEPLLIQSALLSLLKMYVEYLYLLGKIYSMLHARTTVREWHAINGRDRKWKWISEISDIR
jgi:hypothetical protein